MQYQGPDSERDVQCDYRINIVRVTLFIACTMQVCISACTQLSVNSLTWIAARITVNPLSIASVTASLIVINLTASSFGSHYSEIS